MESGSEPVISRRWLILFLSVAVVLTAVFYFLLQRLDAGPHVPPPSPDSVMLHQYGRAIAEGHPYSYNEGDAPTTGSTSHIYPVIVAFLYFVGAKGAALSTSVFLFDALCMVLLLTGVWVAVRRVAPAATLAAMGLVLLSGHVNYIVYSQSDMALFMVTGIWAFAFALHGRWLPTALMLSLASLNRPEGLIMSVAMMVSAAAPLGAQRSVNGRMLAAGVFGMTTFGAVLVLNRVIAGHFMFTSILAKGVTSEASPALVVSELADRFASLVTGVLFALQEPDRRLILLPVFGGALALIGLASRPWREGRDSRVELWFVLCLAGVMAMVSMSGWGGTQYDRYFGWLFPLWFMYAAIGAREAGRRIPVPHAWPAIGGLLVGYQILGLAYMVAALVQSSAVLVPQKEFIEEVEASLPEDSRIGSTGNIWVKYLLPEYTVANIYGICSPEFVYVGSSPHVNVEELRHHPSKRFDCWLLRGGQAEAGFYTAFLGSPLAAQLPYFSEAVSLSLYDADWSSVDDTARPLDPRIAALVDGLERVDEMNVGYVPHQERSGYRVTNRVAGSSLPMITETLELGGRRVTEAGRVVLGGESMRIAANPGKPMTLVMRTATLVRVDQWSRPQRFGFTSPLKLEVKVNGKDAGTFSILLNDLNRFTEAEFVIPGNLINGESVELEIRGDYASFAYWFYQ